MKRLPFLIVFLFFSLVATAQKSIPKPNPPRLVVDYANVLLPEQRDALENKLEALDDSTSNQIAIVLVQTLNDQPIEDVAVNTFREWGIGGSKHNNGILILAAIQDRKIRIEVGYGLEGAIPDVTAQSIIDNDIAPNFREQNYYRGLNLAITSLGEAAAGEYHDPREGNDSDGGGGGVFILIVIIVIIIMIISRGGRGGGGMMSRRGSGWLGPFILGNMIGSSSRGWGGGGWGSGGGWGGGSGGFGGFGGGSSGGGGASGGW